jgi:hypothetical protein
VPIQHLLTPQAMDWGTASRSRTHALTVPIQCVNGDKGQGERLTRLPRRVPITFDTAGITMLGALLRSPLRRMDLMHRGSTARHGVADELQAGRFPPRMDRNRTELQRDQALILGLGQLE